MEIWAHMSCGFICEEQLQQMSSVLAHPSTMLTVSVYSALIPNSQDQNSFHWKLSGCQYGMRFKVLEPA